MKLELYPVNQLRGWKSRRKIQNLGLMVEFSVPQPLWDQYQRNLLAHEDDFSPFVVRQEEGAPRLNIPFCPFFGQFSMGIHGRMQKWPGKVGAWIRSMGLFGSTKKWQSNNWVFFRVCHCIKKSGNCLGWKSCWCYQIHPFPKATTDPCPQGPHPHGF